MSDTKRPPTKREAALLEDAEYMSERGRDFVHSSLAARGVDIPDPTPSPEKPSAEQERVGPVITDEQAKAIDWLLHPEQPNPASTEHPERRRWTIRVCRDCGEIAGSATSFGPWCHGTKRGHNAERVEVVETASSGEAKDAG